MASKASAMAALVFLSTVNCSPFWPPTYTIDPNNPNAVYPMKHIDDAEVPDQSVSPILPRKIPIDIRKGDPIPSSAKPLGDGLPFAKWTQVFGKERWNGPYVMGEDGVLTGHGGTLITPVVDDGVDPTAFPTTEDTATPTSETQSTTTEESDTSHLRDYATWPLGLDGIKGRRTAAEAEATPSVPLEPRIWDHHGPTVTVEIRPTPVAQLDERGLMRFEGLHDYMSLGDRKDRRQETVSFIIGETDIPLPTGVSDPVTLFDSEWKSDTTHMYAPYTNGKHGDTPQNKTRPKHAMPNSYTTQDRTQPKSDVHAFVSILKRDNGWNGTKEDITERDIDANSKIVLPENRTFPGNGTKHFNGMKPLVNVTQTETMDAATLESLTKILRDVSIIYRDGNQTGLMDFVDKFRGSIRPQIEKRLYAWAHERHSRIKKRSGDAGISNGLEFIEAIMTTVDSIEPLPAATARVSAPADWVITEDFVDTSIAQPGKANSSIPKFHRFLNTSALAQPTPLAKRNLTTYLDRPDALRNYTRPLRSYSVYTSPTGPVVTPKPTPDLVPPFDNPFPDPDFAHPVTRGFDSYKQGYAPHPDWIDPDLHMDGPYGMSPLIETINAMHDKMGAPHHFGFPGGFMVVDGTWEEFVTQGRREPPSNVNNTEEVAPTATTPAPTDSQTVDHADAEPSPKAEASAVDDGMGDTHHFGIPGGIEFVDGTWLEFVDRGRWDRDLKGDKTEETAPTKTTPTPTDFKTVDPADVKPSPKTEKRNAPLSGQDTKTVDPADVKPRGKVQDWHLHMKLQAHETVCPLECFYTRVEGACMCPPHADPRPGWHCEPYEEGKERCQFFAGGDRGPDY